MTRTTDADTQAEFGPILGSFLAVGHNPDGSIQGHIPIYNPKDFGAVGDGAADDTSAIQGAISACIAAGGGTILLPAGTYKITSPLDFSALKGTNHGLTFRGAGSGNLPSSLPSPAQGSTTILCQTGRQAITAYGTGSLGIVGLRLGGFMVLLGSTSGASVVGTTTSGSPTVTSIASTAGLAANMTVNGTGITDGTRIKSVDSASQITLTINATASGSPTLQCNAFLVDIDSVWTNLSLEDIVVDGGGASGSGGYAGNGFSFTNFDYGQYDISQLWATSFDAACGSVGYEIAAAPTSNRATTPASGNGSFRALTAFGCFKGYRIGTNITGANPLYGCHFSALKAVNAFAAYDVAGAIGFDLQGQIAASSFDGIHSERWETPMVIQTHDCEYGGMILTGVAAQSATNPLILKGNAAQNKLGPIKTSLSTGGILIQGSAQGNVLYVEDTGTPSSVTDTSTLKTNTVFNLGSRPGGGSVKPYVVGWNVAKTREAIRQQSQGLIDENFPRILCNAGSAAVSGTRYGVLLGFKPGDIISGLEMGVTVNLAVGGATGLLFKIGVWDQAKNLLASSADISANIASPGFDQLFSSTYTVTGAESGALVDGGVGLYCGFIYYQGSGGTPTAPSLLRVGAAVSQAMQAIGTHIQPGFTETGQTDIGNITTFGSASEIGYWVAAKGTPAG